MIVILYFDWFGTPESLEKWNKAYEKACKETEGIKSTKLYTSHQARYHYARIIETESYDAVMKVSSKMPERNRNDLTHAVIEVFSEM